MDHVTPPQSSPRAESSPQGSSGTGPTEYSPLTERARGKQPVRNDDSVTPSVSYQSIAASIQTPAFENALQKLSSLGIEPCFTTSMSKVFDGYCTRHLLIDGHLNHSLTDAIMTRLQSLNIPGEVDYVDYHVTKRDHVFVLDFDDLCRALRAREVIRQMLEHPDLDPSGASIRVEFIDPCEASGRRLAFEGNLRVAAKPLEAQVHVQVKFLIAPNWPRPYAPHDNPSITHHEEVGLVLCTSYFAKYAPVFHAHSDHGLQRIDTDTLTYHLELDSVAAAEHLVLHWADPRGRAWLGRQMYISGFAGVYWHVSSITPAGSQQGLALQYPPEDGPGGAGSRIRLFTSQGGPPVHVGHGSTYHPYGSCNDRQFPPGSGGFANPAMQISGVINCGNLAVRRHRGRTWNPHDNTVSFVHILDGTDVRTTIMLRNIPNKMTDMQLLKILYDAGFRGLIDFMYLRMDFKSGANVGYAFFNLTSPIHIIKFLEHFEGRPWPFHTTGPTMKLAEISYATSQGLEALIQKFRNSSVMRELKCCRPKLFYTFQDNVRIGLVGTEVEFPAPDNEQKLERSIQNAQSIGLFPPNGRGGASPNRRDRFSMFDRGTPRDLAAAHYPMAGYGPISPMQFRHANDNHPFGY